MKDAFSHPLACPIVLPDQTLTEIKFPRMKGKYMRKFTVTMSRPPEGAETSNAAADEPNLSVPFNYGQYMTVGEAMLADVYGPVSARLIFDEMDPEDVHTVVALVGERFAGGQATGQTP
jgi:hypothetical protein